MKGTLTFTDGDIVLGEGQTAQESGCTLTHPADMSVAEGSLTTEQAEVVFGEWLKGDKGDAPVITAADDGTLYADGTLLTTVLKDKAAEAHSAAVAAGLRIYCTEAQYDALKEAGTLHEDYEYNIYEEEESE